MTQQLTTLIQQAEALSVNDQLTLIAHLAQKLKLVTDQPASQDPSEALNSSTPVKTLWQIADDFMSDLSEEDLAQLPHDGAVEHDHYIYGTPKNQ